MCVWCLCSFAFDKGVSAHKSLFSIEQEDQEEEGGVTDGEEQNPGRSGAVLEGPSPGFLLS